ncbi:AraC family transcriptional regulator [Ramlibacter rhizophilus]|uniref:AraC family transcriptional regulator n=1 Tax=Ramlibacter rhizophilus TaxID=1781167 RepID=A0A4Z0C1K9_9BURK|nr:AraC family transcriptional regulator [Ramlibacter rhizophilus]TFZ04822.1 AraC family transcriptional regulator [Ramlibacter rhizophilus]
MIQDSVSDVLRCVRLRAALFHAFEAEPPWCIDLPRLDRRTHAAASGGHLLACHLLLQGAACAAVTGQPALELMAGDALVLPHGDAHRLASAAALPEPAEEAFLFGSGAPHPAFIRLQGARLRAGAAQPRLLCGFLECEPGLFDPLLAALPRIIHVPVPALKAALALPELALLAGCEDERPGHAAMLERLGELMLIECLRAHLDTLPADSDGWLRGLRDRHVACVLGLMHEQPQQAWTLGMLADRTGLSRSALHERFVHFIGMPPMHYLARWRMQTASRLMAQTSTPIAGIAVAAGYESEAAFSRAFKRSVGLPPSVWRRRHRADGAGDGPLKPPAAR